MRKLSLLIFGLIVYFAAMAVPAPPARAAACGDPIYSYADCMAQCHCEQDMCLLSTTRCQVNFLYCKGDCMDWFTDGRT